MVNKFDHKNQSVEWNKQDNLYHQLAESVRGVMMAQFLQDGRITFISPSVMELLGYEAEWMHEKKLFEFLHPEDLNPVLNQLKACQTSSNVLVHCRLKNNKQRFLNFDLQLIPQWENEQLIGINGLLKPIITPSKVSQEYEDYFNRQNIGGAIFDHELILQKVNVKLTQILDCQPENLIGRSLESLLTTEDRGQVKNLLRKLKEGEEVRSKVRMYRYQGSMIWADLSLAPLEIESGQVISMVGNFVDITKQEEKMNQVEALERQYRLIADNVTDVISIHNLGGNYRYVSPSVAKVFGYNMDELIGKLPYDLIHPNDLDEFKNLHYQLLFPDSSKVLEYRFKKKNGAYIWVETSAKSVGNGIYEPFEFICVTRDITERKLSEKFLLEKEATTRALLNAPLDEITVFDEDSLLIDCNETFLARKKKLREEVLGLTDLQLYGLKQPIHQVIKNKIPVVYEQIREGKYYENITFPIIENLKASKVAIFSRDISERKQYEDNLKLNEQKLASQNESLRIMNEELDNFAYRTSHDLRAPLSSVLGLLDLLEISVDCIERDKYLGLIRKSIKKLDDFVLDILNFSRNNRLELQLEAIHFSMVEEILQGLLIEDLNSIKTTVNVKQDGMFYSDRYRLKFIFNNLISNSIRYANPRSEGSWIDIDITSSNEKATITISDNGIGISNEHQPNVFGMFYRATNMNAGSGLGLYIVKQAVDKLGGKINLESKIGTGTKIEIIIPNHLHNPVNR